ncbi:hypothetical protein GCM10009853_015570 [Glycomyces scopariae]
MSLTTPPRPHDPLEAVPDLARFARSAVRLHPRRGEPVAAQSSVGGPLLWPVEEPWPLCRLEHANLDITPFDLHLQMRYDRRMSELRDGGFTRMEFESRRNLADKIALDLVTEDDPEFDLDGPTPLVPVAQLYYRDVPGLPWADRYDLLQILWCPRDHTGTEHDTSYCPAFQLRWRRTDTIGESLTAVPEPALVVERYMPNPCLLNPEVVTEYPISRNLPPELEDAVNDWENRLGVPALYDHQTSVAPGWKVMGHGGSWGVIDPEPMFCECGAEQFPLFTVGSGEFDGGSRSWRPVEETGSGREFSDPVSVTIGRGYTLGLYYCPESEDHQGRTEMF